MTRVAGHLAIAIFEWVKVFGNAHSRSEWNQRKGVPGERDLSRLRAVLVSASARSRHCTAVRARLIALLSSPSGFSGVSEY